MRDPPVYYECRHGRNASSGSCPTYIHDGNRLQRAVYANRKRLQGDQYKSLPEFGQYPEPGYNGHAQDKVNHRPAEDFLRCSHSLPAVWGALCRRASGGTGRQERLD